MDRVRKALTGASFIRYQALLKEALYAQDSWCTRGARATGVVAVRACRLQRRGYPGGAPVWNGSDGTIRSVGSTPAIESSGLADRSLSRRRELAQAPARHEAFAQGMDVGIVWWRVRGISRSHLDRNARRAAASGRRGAVDALRRAEPDARKRDGQRRWHQRHVRAHRKTRMGTALRALDLRGRRRRQSRRRVAASRAVVRQAPLRPRAPPNQDQPVRSAEARVDHRRPAPRHLQVHLRRQAGVHAWGAWCARTWTEHLRSSDRHRVAA